MQTKLVSRFKTEASDVDKLREHYARTLKPVHVSPLAGHKTISVEDTHFSMGDFDVWSGNCASGMDVQFIEPLDKLVLYLPHRGVMRVLGEKETSLSAYGSIMVCSLDRVRSLHFEPGRSHLGIAFAKTAVTRYLSDALDSPITQDIELDGVFSLSQQPFNSLSRLCHLIWHRLSEDPETNVQAASNELLTKSLMAALLENVDHKYSSVLRGHKYHPLPRHVVRAVEYMRENLSAPISTEGVAREVGVSVRSLQLAFQHFKEVTPGAYLRQLRLEAVRHELLSGNSSPASIEEIGRKWGFTHPGRFSTLYKQAFGESPRETLSNRKTAR